MDSECLSNAGRERSIRSNLYPGYHQHSFYHLRLAPRPSGHWYVFGTGVDMIDAEMTTNQAVT